MLPGADHAPDCSPRVCAWSCRVGWAGDGWCLSIYLFTSNAYIILQHFSHEPLGLCLQRLVFVSLLWARPILLETYHFSLVEGAIDYQWFVKMPKDWELHTEFPCDPASPHMGRDPQEMKAGTWNRYLHTCPCSQQQDSWQLEGGSNPVVKEWIDRSRWRHHFHREASPGFHEDKILWG